MTDSTGPRGGGAFLAIAILVGALAGVFTGQPSIGVVAGIGVGVLIALLLWWRDRRR